MNHPVAITLLFLSLNVASVAAFADDVEWRGYTIYYTTLASTLIPNEVAAAHDITRADNRIIANIVIRRKDAAVHAAVSGTVTDLLNKTSPLQFKEISEDDAVYYLASHVADEQETLRFDLDIRPEGEADSYHLKFLRTWE